MVGIDTKQNTLSTCMELSKNKCNQFLKQVAFHFSPSLLVFLLLIWHYHHRQVGKTILRLRSSQE